LISRRAAPIALAAARPPACNYEQRLGSRRRQGKVSRSSRVMERKSKRLEIAHFIPACLLFSMEMRRRLGQCKYQPVG